uniref:Lariat debranching enzyme C-terminal domain-containing protein n=1 Tax=Trichuris muris TaxID=70415 RepID=A0A5S6QP24_TRIMR
MTLTVGVVGCAHGELEIIYDTVKKLKQERNVDLDLLICCGDFQSVRDERDLTSMAVPAKYRRMNTFRKYYTGELQAPVLTLFVGGNHEASNYLWQLPHGGWVAPGIYFMGQANVLNFGGLRIGGLSGIYKSYSYLRGHFEKPPFDEEEKRSVYHIRSLEVLRLKQLNKPLDVFVSHDWPRGIDRFGDRQRLFAFKQHFVEEAENGELGSLPGFELLRMLKPKYWFAAHMHAKFAALVPHEDGSVTRFLALDKCLPRRQYFQVLELQTSFSTSERQLCYDPEWLAILRKTDHLLSISSERTLLSNIDSNDPFAFSASAEDIKVVEEIFDNNFLVPSNLSADRAGDDSNVELNPQTIDFSSKLGIRNLPALLLSNTASDSTANESAAAPAEEFVDEAPLATTTEAIVPAEEICLDDI